VPKNAAALFVGRALVMVVSFVFLITAARFLGLAGFGRYALVRMYFDLLLTLSVTGLGILVTREIAKAPVFGSLYFGTAAPLAIALAAMMGGGLVVLSPLMGYAPDVRSMLLLAWLALLPASFAMLSEAVFVALGKAPYVMFGGAGEALLYSSIGLVLLSLGHGSTSLFVALVATRGCLAMLYAALIYRQFGQIPRPGSVAFVRTLCRDWRIFALENWLANLTASMGTIVLSMFHREATVGVYAAASRITSFGAPLVASFTSAMFPYLSQLHERSSQAVRRVGEESLKYMVAVALPGVVIIATFADWVILTLYGDTYAGAVPVLRVVIWVFVLNFVNPFVSHLLFARGEQGVSLRVGAVTAVVSLTLSLLLIPQWGASGAAWALLASTGLACWLFCAAAFRPDATRVLMVFGKATIAAASLAGVLAIGSRVHPAALTILALGVYVSVLLLLRVSSVRELSASFRGVA
jgi:O-antigen/teichoic acid export membrane protein